MMRPWLKVGALTAGVLVLPLAAQASGFDASRIGGERGHAAAATPFATYLNPAALAGTSKVHLGVDATLALHSSTFERTESDVDEPDDAQGANIGTANQFDVLAGPTLAGSLNLGDVAIGLGVFAPMSGSASWDGNSAFAGNTDYPGAQDGVARWFLIEGDLSTLYTSLAASYSIPSIGLSLGVGGNLVYSRFRLLRARTPSGDDRLSAEGRIDLDVDGFTGSFSTGLMWEALDDKLWFGLSYQAPPGMYKDVTLKGTVRTYIADSTTDDVELKQAYPDIVRWATRFAGSDKYELRLFGDFQRWSVMDRQCLTKAGSPCDLNPDGSPSPGTMVVANHPRHWQNAYSVRAGGSYWITPKVEALVGLGYEGTAIRKKYLEPGLIDGHDLSGTGGVRLRIGENVGLMLSYTHVHTLPITVTNSALAKASPPSSLPTANGEYKQWVGMGNAFLEVYFD